VDDFRLAKVTVPPDAQIALQTSDSRTVSWTQSPPEQSGQHPLFKGIMEQESASAYLLTNDIENPGNEFVRRSDFRVPVRRESPRR